MTVPLLIVALILCFAWAITASDAAVGWMQHANDDADRAERATEFAEDCLAENRDLRDLNQQLDDKLADTERRWLQALVGKVCAEAELRGQENPLPGVEPTPIADGLHFDLWADELGGAS